MGSRAVNPGARVGDRKGARPGPDCAATAQHLQGVLGARYDCPLRHCNRTAHD